MNEELRELIQNWQNTNEQLGENRVDQLNDTFKDGEFIFVLTKSIDLNYLGISQQINISRIFATLAQNDEKLNPNGDIHNFNRLVENIERDFADQLSSTISEILNN